METSRVIEVHKLNIDGVILNVRIDYKQGTVSFIDEQGNKNRFDFSNRTREYLGGWVKIFRALEKATIWADARLAEEQKRVKDVKNEKMTEILIAVSDLDRKKK